MTTIVPFLPEHQPGIDQLLLSIASEYNEPYYDPTGKKMIDLYTLPGRHYWVAIDDGRVIGTVGIIICNEGHAVLKSMFLHRHHHGSAVARQLLDIAMEGAVQHCCSYMYLGTMAQFKAAQRFYEKHGFDAIAEDQLPADFPGNVVDTVFYKKKLPIAHRLGYRTATPADTEAVIALGVAAYSQHAAALGDDAWALMKKNILEKFAGLMEHATTFICTAGNRLVGVACLISSGNPDDIYPAEWCYIRMVGVHPQFSGFGIARRLTEMCIAQAKERGENTVALHTSEFMDAARHIYEGLGFRVLRELSPRFGKKYWLYTMELNS